MNKCYIYSLEVEGIPFYIGKTNNLTRRQKEHISGKKRAGWGKYTLFPKEFAIAIIDEIPISEWEFWERHYISLFKSWGFRLLNVNGGGELPMRGYDKSQKEIRFIASIEHLPFLQKLRAIRRMRKTTIEELSKVTGINRDRISLIERGLVNPSFRTVELIIKTLGAETYISLSEFSNYTKALPLI